jgi:hypothetical protein
MEHIRVFDGFVVPLWHADDDYSPVFAQVKKGGAYQVAHIFNRYDTVGYGVEFFEGMCDHFGIEVAAFAGIDLYDRGTRFSDAIGVVQGLLIAFDNADGKLGFEVAECPLQQTSLAGTWGADEIQGQDIACFEEPAVAFGEELVFLKDIQF